jgi:hypothetical protein
LHQGRRTHGEEALVIAAANGRIVEIDDRIVMDALEEHECPARDGRRRRREFTQSSKKQ